jgi:hypothetical protein
MALAARGRRESDRSLELIEKFGRLRGVHGMRVSFAQRHRCGVSPTKRLKTVVK